MAEKRKAKRTEPAAKTSAKARGAKAKSLAPESRKKSGKRAAPPTPKRASATKKAGGAAKKPATKTRKRSAKAERSYAAGEPILDPIGDVTSGEAHTYLGPGAAESEVEGPAASEMEAFRNQTNIEASDAILEAGPGMEAAQEALEAHARKEAEDTAAAEPDAEEREDAEPAADRHEAPKPERLQKILAQAGIASRRRAEEMIVAGRVMVNGQVVTQLGSKADPARDHIRVDGKLLHGAERHRYFVLNKPGGFVTTASDPEGRPTVMQFFARMRERLFPVGRLDFHSEGLLLMTNDGALANLLTNAGSGVEKTYLVKVAGQPSAEQLERLREGVKIEKDEKGSERVRTAPARIRQVRGGENPWFEVVLIEGRNRELRKMFAAIGHYAEKIRRVGYGPLALDVEPGTFRELTTGEVNALRLTAEGKMRPRQIQAERMLPATTPTGKNRSFATPRDASVPAAKRETARGRFDRFQPRPGGQGRRPEEKPRWKREERGPGREGRPRGEFRGAARPERGENRFEDKQRGKQRGSFKPHGERPEFRPGPRPERGEEQGRRNFSGAQRGNRFSGQRSGKPRENRFGGAERRERPSGGANRKPFRAHGERPFWKRGGEGPRRGEPAQPFEGGRSKAFGKGANSRAGRAKPQFGGKPGGPGKFRGEGPRGPKRGFSRPGAQRGGWKRG